LIRPALIVVLLLSGVKLVGASNGLLAAVAPTAVAVAVSYALWSWRRALARSATVETEPVVGR
jgi:hypothetical protein